MLYLCLHKLFHLIPQRPRFRPGPKKKTEHPINEDVLQHPEVRVVGENIQTGVYPTRKALELAMEMGLDLVEISPNANPPVCRIVDYNKFLYEKKKKEKEIKAHSQKITIKEIRFTPNTDEHDIDFKSKHAEKFIQEGNKVKAFVMFRGRSIVFKEQGELLLLQFAKKLEEVAVVEQLPLLEGKKMMMTLAPKRKK